MDADTSRWSGDGGFTRLLIDALARFVEIRSIRVEDAPASRAESGYNFIANELFVEFAAATVGERRRWLGVVPHTVQRTVFSANLADLTTRLASLPGIGEPDYADEGMIQYLRTERVVAPYQTRGIKVIELVRIYRADAPAR
jgi:hypothetical protein